MCPSFERLLFTLLCLCVCQMVLPLSQLINALHSLKNSATASVQTLHRDFIPEHSSFVKEVRWTPRIDDMIPSAYSTKSPVTLV